MQSRPQSESLNVQHKGAIVVATRSSVVRVHARTFSVLIIAVLLLAAMVFCPLAHGQQASSIDREYAIKAEFLCHFLHYINWPAGTFANEKQPYVIGVFGSDPFGVMLEKTVATKYVAGRTIEIRRFTAIDRVQQCHIVFVPGTVAAEAQRSLLESLASANVLVVGESDEFVEMGGTAYFFVENSKVRFAFNTEVVERSQIKVSSKLLSLAKIVSIP